MELDPKGMADEQAMEAEYSYDKSTQRKRKADMVAVNDNDALRATLMKRLTLSLTKPSYILGLGSKMIRSENRITLHRLLHKLMRHQNWAEASGVLSMLLKGTLRDRSPAKNRSKYLEVKEFELSTVDILLQLNFNASSPNDFCLIGTGSPKAKNNQFHHFGTKSHCTDRKASMELLECVESGPTRPNRIKHIYDNWMRKIGSMKHWPIEDRFVVHVEFILFCLKEGNIEDAHQAALCLMQEHESVKDPMSNMIIGLTFRQLWYSTIPEELQWSESLQFHSPIQSDRMISNPGGSFVSDSHEADAQDLCNSDTSVMNDKLVRADNEMHMESSFEADYNLQEIRPQSNEPQDFYLSSEETNGNEASFSYHGDNQHCVSIFSAIEGLDPILLPIRLPLTIESWEGVINICGEFLNDYYKDAVKHLDIALNSDRPLFVALLPLIQLLLIGGQFDKALNEVEKFCHDSNAILPLRLRAALVEHFDRNNRVLLSTCYEKILEKDPTCCQSLKKLVDMHRNGYYSLESLLEMIALHLDGTSAEYDTWREFALCFLKLFLCEEDRVSVCSTGAAEHKPISSFNVNRNLRILNGKSSRNSWRLRCRWWSTRHFGQKILASETLLGHLELLAYKAACASHIYGRNFEYVVKVHSLLEDQNNKDLLSFLRNHMQNSAELHTKL